LIPFEPLDRAAAGLFHPQGEKRETISGKDGLTGLDDFAEVVEKHQTMVFRTLARLTGDREGLEDLAQEVFLRLFRALPHFRREAQIGTFLYRIIVNVVNDEFRRRQKARLATPIDEETGALSHPGPGPAELLEQSQLHEAVDAALLELNPRDRAILTLHYQEGRSYEEIAAILDEPIGTVKTHLYRARARLKVMMKEWTTCGIRN
jgi:RNA polymerase sigma-70 factor (ECF subfamily)